MGLGPPFQDRLKLYLLEGLSTRVLSRGRQPEKSFFFFDLPSYNYIHVAKYLFHHLR